MKRLKVPKTLWCAACKVEVKVADKTAHETETHFANVAKLYFGRASKVAIARVMEWAGCPGPVVPVHPPTLID